MQPYCQLTQHHGSDWPEWGSAPRRPLIQCDMAHQGELLDSVIGPHPVTGVSMVYHVVRCDFCIGTHLWPLADPADLEAYYRERFYQTSHPTYLAEYAEDRAWWFAVHRGVFDVVQRWVYAGARTFLDVGAGPGYPLEVARERGYRGVALEPNALAAAALEDKGFLVGQCSLATFAAATDRRYALLWAWEVLEHQPNPDDFLLQCHHLLVDGGVLVVAVPNDFAPGQLEACRRFHLSPWWVAPPEHQWYWTPKTLQLALRRAGFAVRYTRMTYPLVEEFLLEQGRCYVGNPALGRQCHQERMAYELAMLHSERWSELEARYIANVEHRVGREIVMIGQKI